MKMFRSILALGLVLGSLFATAPAQAVTFANENGKIAFTKVHNGQNGIWLMDSDGQNKQLLIQSTASNLVWSPDGSKLAFINNEGRLSVVDHYGRNVRQLTHTRQFIDDTPAWSPDGRQIAFVRQEKFGQKRSAIFSVKLNGVNQAVNISGWAQGQSYRSPSWAPDAQRIVYEHLGQNAHELLIKNTKNGIVRVLTTVSDEVNARPQWSPNGKKILFNDSPTEMYTIWTDSTHRSAISDGESYQASWSPDGNKIVFLEDPQDNTISISESDGSITYIPVEKDPYNTLATPIWSPDGAALLFAVRDNSNNVSDIFLLNLNEPDNFTKLSDTSGEYVWQAKPVN
ncbi:MAG TPA: hypothetical protein VFT87_03840 [Candidatus Saccharimonadales bacterium]|nr:hypothetical protein [Candidatus Saccharimonadales bacterium]